MPSLAVLPETLSPSSEVLKTKTKKMKNDTSETVGLESSIKKEKKSKKNKTDTPSDTEKSEKKSKKKRKASSDTDNEEGKSDTSELVEPVNLKVCSCSIFKFN